MEARTKLFKGKFFEKKAKSKENDSTLQVLLGGMGALIAFLLILFVFNSKGLALFSLFVVVSVGIMINAK